MKALVYHGPWDVQIDDKPQPTIQHPEDAILHITSTAICGSDLHLYHGTVPGMQPGQTLGHEFMGIIEEIGPEVHEVQVGDRVVVPFNVNCGFLKGLKLMNKYYFLATYFQLVTLPLTLQMCSQVMTLRYLAQVLLDTLQF